MFGAPEVETLEDIAVPVAHAVEVLNPRFSADGNGHAVDCFWIKRCPQPDRLREYGDTARIRHAMQRLAPPVVVRHTQPGNGSRLIHQLRDLFFNCHAMD